jgi:exodeoxyribonuclease-3
MLIHGGLIADKHGQNNVGWRIDYQVISPDLAAKITAANVYKETRLSDHAPLIIDYQFDVQ